MLFETPEQFEKKLKVVADRIDSTGELTELVIDYLIGEDTYDEILINKFLIFLRTKGDRIPYVSSLENPRYGNLPVDLVGENAYKYYFGAPACGNSSFVQRAKELLNEVSYYLAILTSVLLAEEKGVVKEGMHERFMTINTLFYTEDDEGNGEGAGERAGESVSIQFGYSATRLDDPCVSPYFLKEATKLFKAFETISAHGAYLVHGDFKIDNVLVDKRGKLCLIDFGLATIRIQFEDGTVLCGRQYHTYA